MTIERTVEIPADHRIFLDLPFELPTGRANVELTFKPLIDTDMAKHGDKIHLTKTLVDELLRGEILQSLTGLLHTKTSAEEIRTERLKKHDCIA
jgi:hypothetical protein